MIEMWETRYSAEEYAYGTSPNVFLKECLKKFKLSGKILFPAEGEGRNAVYAAKTGLDVFAFDISTEGKKKALKLAQTENVQINYKVGDFFEMIDLHQPYDAAAFIFAHFPPPLLSKFHHKIGELIVTNGLILLEGFSKTNLKRREENPEVGGPNNLEMLFSTDSIKADFPNFEVILLEEKEIVLREGKFHNGNGSVIRFIGRKK